MELYLQSGVLIIMAIILIILSILFYVKERLGEIKWLLFTNGFNMKPGFGYYHHKKYPITVDTVSYELSYFREGKGWIHFKKDEHFEITLHYILRYFKDKK